MANAQLTAEPRTITGKKVKTLRRRGIIPGNIYGLGQESQAVQLPAQDVNDVLRHGGRAQIIDLSVEGGKAPVTAMIRGVHRNPVSRQIAHVEFLRVSMSETLTMNVPLTFTGHSPAVRTLGGTLVQSLDHVTVTGLPGAIPTSIEVDTSILTELDQGLFVRDLPGKDGVEITTDPDLMVAKIAPPRVRGEGEGGEAGEAVVDADAAS